MLGLLKFLRFSELVSIATFEEREQREKLKKPEQPLHQHIFHHTITIFLEGKILAVSRRIIGRYVPFVREWVGRTGL